jgi:hypothetical protein
MPKITIQQFRAMMTGHTTPGTLVRAYREITRRPELVAGMRAAGWAEWPQLAAGPNA